MTGHEHAHDHAQHDHAQHDHGDEHEHGEEHGHDRAHQEPGHSFDERAATWDDDPDTVAQAQVVAELVARVLDLHPGLRVLEYGAGTALLSQQLAARIGPLTVADPSTGMRQVLAGKVSSGVLPAGTEVSDLDLSGPTEATDRFDLVLTQMALHHVPDVPAVLRGFAAVLPPGGRVAICDLVAEDGTFHRAEDFTGHAGFDTDELARWLAEAGFSDVQVRHAHDLPKDGRTYPVFLATATRG